MQGELGFTAMDRMAADFELLDSRLRGNDGVVRGELRWR